ncbi:hypothetical protein Sru01_16810 [Sphaerisporangium rufum]|uniref:DUF397 domain-containing protein n=1 Tax=Sphaerisporangium rufum TaxID=1381558 RepID=A0A919QZ29_9ACTN|nr:DUF397 domain-containing protein [Sphaerisporangium rufum]GII76699.1 hypothetical protein Sru01_16810 [Sphaerisporangium rufum]
MELSAAEWRKSSHSGSDGGSCVEVATNVPGLVALRDSKIPNGPTITVRPEHWRGFLRMLAHRR